jgi:hypothetical protein
LGRYIKTQKGGGFEPCGRPDAAKGAYPKCVPASKAAKMTQEEETKLNNEHYQKIYQKIQKFPALQKSYDTVEFRSQHSVTILYSLYVERHGYRLSVVWNSHCFRNPHENIDDEILGQTF